MQGVKDGGRRMPEESVGPAEMALLRRLAQVGGRYTFRPEGEGRVAQRAFEEGIVADVRRLYGKGLVRIDLVATVFSAGAQGTELTGLTVGTHRSWSSGD
jgi:hypothetical protein